MNEQFHCETIKGTVTPYICQMRKEAEQRGETTMKTCSYCERNNGGVEMGEFKGTHKGCSKEGCDKYAVKDGICSRHYKEIHGVLPYPPKKKNSGIKLPPVKIKLKKKKDQQVKSTGPVPEAALMGAIKKYAMDGIKSQVMPIINRIEVDLLELKRLIS